MKSNKDQHEEENKNPLIRSQAQWKQAFFKACETGQLSNLRYCLETSSFNKQGWVNVHEVNSLNQVDFGFTLACRNGHLPLVQYLLTSDDLYRATGTRVTLHRELFGLVDAAQKGCLDIVKYMLTSPEVRDCQDESSLSQKEYWGVNKKECLVMAMAHDQKEIVEFMMTSMEMKEAGLLWGSLNEERFGQPDTAILLACQFGSKRSLKWLLSSKALEEAGHPKVTLDNALYWSALCSHFQHDLIRWLILDLKHEINPYVERILQEDAFGRECLRIQREQEILMKTVSGEKEQEMVLNEEGGLIENEVSLKCMNAKKAKKL